MPSKKSFPLRVSEPMYEALRRWAEDEFRSVNGQIEYLLNEALRRAGRAPKREGGDGKGRGETKDSGGGKT